MEHLLEARDIKMYFGGVKAVDGISTHIDTDEILGIIGPNGSGKTTFFNALTGIYTATAGTFLSNGRDITGKPLNEMVHYGIARTFQNLRIFKALTVRENAMVGAHVHLDTNLLDAFFHTRRWKRGEREAGEKAQDVLRLVGLADHADEIAGSLPYGMQKRLELARALIIEPTLLLLDEPTAGMNSVESHGLMELVQAIKQEKKFSVILIEHNMKLMMRIADRILAMDAGREIAHGKPEDVQKNPKVIKAYLGEG